MHTLADYLWGWLVVTLWLYALAACAAGLWRLLARRRAAPAAHPLAPAHPGARLTVVDAGVGADRIVLDVQPRADSGRLVRTGRARHPALRGARVRVDAESRERGAA